MQNVVPRRERNFEITLFVGLKLNDLSAFRAIHRDRGLIRPIGAILSLDHDRAHRPDRDPTSDATVNSRGSRLQATGRGQQNNGS